LLGRYYGADKQTRGDAAYLTFFAIGAGVLGYAAYMITAIFNYFFVASDWTLSLQQLIVMIILTSFAVTAETFVFPKMKSIKIGSFKLGIIGLIAIFVVIYLIIMTIIDIVDVDDEWNFLAFIPVFIAYAVFGLIGFAGFVNILFIKLSPQKEIKRKILLGLLFGVVALSGSLIGAMGRSDFSDLFIYGTIIEIVGWLFLRTFFLSIPSYNELEWKLGIIEMHVIMAETGISLYYRSFHKINPEQLKGNLEVTMTLPESEARPNTDLIGGGMIGIKGMLSEIAGTKGKLRNIQIGEKHLLFNQGNVVLVLLLADNNLGVYHSILYKMVHEIEIAHPTLENFNGDTRQLKISPIVDKFFGEEKPSKGQQKK
jgi:hypothetical protein